MSFFLLMLIILKHHIEFWIIRAHLKRMNEPYSNRSNYHFSNLFHLRKIYKEKERSIGMFYFFLINACLNLILGFAIVLLWEW